MDLYFYVIVMVLFIMFIVALALGISNNRRLKELNEYAEDGDLAETLKEYYKKIAQLKTIIHKSSDKALESRIAACEERLNTTYSKLYVVNFDAFDDVTGKLSFAAALLDDTNSGIILTSIYGHSSSNTYIRYVVDGTTNVKLIDEEKLALGRAITGEKKVLNSAE